VRFFRNHDKNLLIFTQLLDFFACKINCTSKFFYTHRYGIKHFSFYKCEKCESIYCGGKRECGDAPLVILRAGREEERERSGKEERTKNQAGAKNILIYSSVTGDTTVM
jgi:hypothetical protein